MKAIIGGIVAMPFMVTASQAQSVCYQGTTCNLSGLDIIMAPLLRRLMPDRATHQPRRFSTEQDSSYLPRLATALKWVPSSQFMFHDSLQNEPHLGISFWEKECPVTKRIAFTIPGASWEDWQFDMRQLGAAI
jgi:hypothetical protein